MITLQIMNEFFTAIKENILYIVAEGIREMKELFFSSWIAGQEDDVEELLAIGHQRIKRGLRDHPEWKDSMAYQIGMLNGIVSAYDGLLQEKREQRAIDQHVRQVLHNSGPVSKKVFIKLISLNSKNEWISHKELASDVGTSESSLSNIMKRLVNARAVEAERIGKRTIYHITPAGERYYSEKYSKLNTEEKYDTTELYNSISKELEELIQSKFDSESRLLRSSMRWATAVDARRMVQYVKTASDIDRSLHAVDADNNEEISKTERNLLVAAEKSKESRNNDAIICSIDFGFFSDFQKAADSNYPLAVCNMQ